MKSGIFFLFLIQVISAGLYVDIDMVELEQNDDDDDEEEAWILSTYPVLTPNKTDYSVNDIIHGCSLTDNTLNKLGVVRERNSGENLRFKIQITKLGRFSEYPIFETVYTYRALLPSKLQGMNFREIAVYAICLGNDYKHYKIQVPMQGMLGASANIEDFSVVYEGQEIECIGPKGGNSLWLYSGGHTQLSSGSTLRVTRPETMDIMTPEFSYSCCSVGAGWHRKIYTFYIGTYYTQLISPAKNAYSPGDIVTCHVYISTMSDVNKVDEAMTNVGIRIMTRLFDETVKYFERSQTSTVLLPEYPLPVKTYSIQCLLNGVAKTESVEFPVLLPFATHLDPFKQVYTADDKVSCKNGAIYGTRRTDIIVFPIPGNRRPTPILTFDALNEAFIAEFRSFAYLSSWNTFLRQNDTLVAFCEIREDHAVYYSTPIYINVNVHALVAWASVIQPKGIQINRITFLIPGAILRCGGRHPAAVSWGLSEGNSDQCQMQTYKQFLIASRVKKSCITVYTCSAYADATNTRMVVIRLIIEVIANFETKVGGTRVFSSPGEQVECLAVGYSNIMDQNVYIPMESVLWLRMKAKPPRYMGTGEIPKTQVPGSFHVDCQENPGRFSDFRPLLVADATSLVIQYMPDKGKVLFTGDIVRCLTKVQYFGDTKLTRLYGGIYAEIISESVAHLLVNRSQSFIVPEWVYLANKKIPITQVKLRIACDFRGKLEDPWMASIDSCDGHLRYIDIEPPYTETVAVGVWFRCTTEDRCRENFQYDIVITSASMEHVISNDRFISKSRPIKITYEMLGLKKVICTASGAGMTTLRKVREVIIEGQPSNMMISRKNPEGYTIEGSVEMVNMNETIHCNALGYPIPRIRWKRISSPQDHKNHELFTHQNMIIVSSFDPSGYYKYQCSAMNNLGKVFHTQMFYVRNIHHISHEGQRVFMYWVSCTLFFFFVFFFLGYFIINAEFLRSHPLALRDPADN